MKKIIGFLLTVAVVLSSIIAVNNSQNIIDWWRLRDYAPSAEISALYENIKLTDYGKKLFYVNDPQVLSKKDFVDSCVVGEETIVLGCYVSGQNIYLYDVEDDRLKGVEEVTAAHEMLHAAYDRLEKDEKTRINTLLQEAYDRSGSERLQKSIQAYKLRDEAVVLNEMHSIIGTELKELPKDLENYYSKYFKDRLKIVALADAYAAEFEDREKLIEAYDTQLTALNGEITRSQADLNAQNEELNKEKNELELLKKNPKAFNDRVDGYNSKVNKYNDLVQKIKIIVEDYNSIVIKRNEIAVEERELVNAIDTRAEQL